jgi:iron only hydrogenase large subunit-like protein
MEMKEKKEIDGIICSECPGWVCYAEKKIGKISFQYMSKVKSPHEISAIIIKEIFKKYLNNLMDLDKNLYICSVMSCFDKKIEPIKYKTGINTVISTIELEERFKNFLSSQNITIKNKIIDIFSLKNCLQEIKSLKDLKELINLKINNNTDEIKLSLYNFPFKENFSSNYYAEYLAFMIIKNNPNFFLERKDGKNIDSKEIIIFSDERKKEIKFKFLISYGLRNIQNIVRMIKSKKIKYDYIEIMACPGGCINGAAQIRVDKTRDEIFNSLKNELEHLSLKKDIINESINKISRLIEEMKINESKFIQNFKEADFSKSDMEW